MADEQEGGAQELEKAVDAIESRIRRDIARTKLNTMITAIVGIIVIVVVFSYLSWLVGRLTAELDPVTLARTVAGLAGDKVPEAIKTMEQNLAKRAPENVGRVFDVANEQVPRLREDAEKIAETLLTSVMDEFDERMGGMVEEILEMLDRAQLKEAIQAALEGTPEELEKQIAGMLEADIGVAMDTILNEKFYPAMEKVEERLDRLSLPDKQLKGYERDEKEMIATVLIFIDDTAKEQLKKK